MGWADVSAFFILNWGASVLSFAVAIMTSAVASKAREAAEAAEAVARRQSLTEVLQDVIRRTSKPAYSCPRASGTSCGCELRRQRMLRVWPWPVGRRS